MKVQTDEILTPTAVYGRLVFGPAGRMAKQ